MENIKSRITLTFAANFNVIEYDKPFLLEESYVEQRIIEMNGLSETSGLHRIQKRLEKQSCPFLWLYIYLNNEYVVYN